MNFGVEIDNTIVDSVLQMFNYNGFSDSSELLQDVYDGDQEGSAQVLSMMDIDGSNITEIGSPSESVSFYNATSPFLKDYSVPAPATNLPSVNGQNLELVSIQSQISSASVGQNPIIRVVPCHIVERENKETFLVFPKQEAVSDAVQGQFVVIPVPGGFQQLLPALPSSSTNNCGSNDNNETDPSRSAVSPAPYIMTSNLSTVEEMQALEDYVKKDSKNKKKLADEFEGRGGTDSKNHMTRALSSLMKLELAGKYSWAGMIRNGEKKNNFKDLTIANILVDAVLSVHYNKKNIKKKNSARLKLENIIKEWLKRQGVASKKAGH